MGKDIEQYYGTGKKKTSIARVFMRLGNGKITINKKSYDEYFCNLSNLAKIFQPLVLTEHKTTFDIMVNINGGGKSGQTDAIRHGISKALVEYDATLKKVLSDAGFITRDSRIVERKKVGLRKARRRRQFSKR